MGKLHNLEVKKIVLWFVLFIGLFSSTGYALGPIYDYDYYPVVVLTLAITLLLVHGSIPKFNKRLIFLYIYFTTAFTLSAITNFEYLTVASFYIPFLLMTIGFIIASYITFNNFLRFYIISMSIISIISLMSYVLIYLLGIPLHFGEIINPNGVSYYNGVLFFVNTLGSRVNGTFWEPGIFATFIFLGLIANEFAQNIKSKWIRILLVITLLFTASTAGYLLLFTYIFIFTTKKIKNPISSTLLVLLFIVSAVFIFTNYNQILDFLIDISPDLFMKLKLGTDESKSVLARIESINAFWNVFTSRWLFGYGFMNAEIRYSVIMEELGLLTNTATSLYYLASIGIFGLAFSLVPLYGVFRISNMTFIVKTIFSLSVLFILNKEPHLFFMLTYIMLFYSIGKSNGGK